jgi:Flp pilus assembly pilin Flp
MKLGKDDSGATAIEYAILMVGIALAIITVVRSIGVKAMSYFTTAGSGW